MFTIKQLKQAIATIQYALIVSQVFSAELKLVFPVFIVLFPYGQFFYMESFTAVEICVFMDNSHAWLKKYTNGFTLSIHTINSIMNEYFIANSKNLFRNQLLQ